MNRKIFSLILLSAQFFTFQFSAQTISDPSTALPDSINGWKKLGEDRLFNDQNLYDYIDGAAELYISFGFTKVFNRIYSAGEGKEIIVDIFYMNTPQDAFGAFSFSVGKMGNDFGTQSQTAHGAILFWKNNFVVSIVENPASEEAKKTSLTIAKLIDESIPEKGSFPEVLKYLPQENLDAQSIRYFRHYIWFNTYTYISGENILNINQNTHGVLAKYGGKEKLILMIIKYPDEQEALAALEKFNKAYYKTLKPKPVVKSKESKFSGSRVVKNFFIGVFGGRAARDVKALITRAHKSISDLTSTK
ncbi:MAG: hypothetical protein FD188_287 [Ignavibacteria bacterium]|nr:MAG: hypothetical protein FD188_287 [Ignavibacteria bacterium]